MAANAGIEVKSSALASVSQDEADQLRALAKDGGGAAVATAAAPEKPSKPQPPRRETPAERKIRDLRTTPTPGHRSRVAAEVEEELKAEEASEASAAEAPAAQPPVEPEVATPEKVDPVAEAVTESAEAVEKADEPSVVESVTESVSETVAAATETVADAVASVAETAKSVTETVVEKVQEKVQEVAEAVTPAAAEPEAKKEEPAAKEPTAEEPVAEEKPEPEAKAVEPAEEKPANAAAETGTDAAATTEDGVKKEDYVAPAGEASKKKKSRRGLLGIRNMQAVGTVRKRPGKKKDDDEDISPTAGNKKEPKKPVIANIVRPNFTGPKPTDPKPDEPAAQKPDISFSPDMASPLGGQMQKSKDKPGGSRTPTPGQRRMIGPGGMDGVRNRRKKTTNKKGYVNRDERIIRPGRGRGRRRRVDPADLKTEAMVESPVDIRALSEAIGRPAKDIISYFWKQGDMTKNVNTLITDDEALEASLELGVELQFKDQVDLEEVLADRLEEFPEDIELIERAPIITILGHVDHGKTTLVDALRSSNVTEGEAGGITQHIAAYQVDHEGRKLTFVDTPGHAAFGAMRARGADVTDIIVLVVAADDGVMPQTVESISHAKEAGVPIVVALNKMDLPDANIEKVFGDLAQHGLQPQEWGGDTEVVRVSALKGDGIDDLLETLLLTAEIEELKGSTEMPAHGLCLEGFQDEGRGPMAWAIIQQGQLNVGDNIVCGGAFGRVRAIFDENDNVLESAGPSTPVKITGLSEVPGAGVHLFEMEGIDEAREVAVKRQESGQKERLLKRGTSAKSLEEILAGEGPKELPVIIKADTPGSVEAIRHELEKFEHDEVGIRILHDAIGGVNESDVYLASTSGATIIAFGVVAEDSAASLADKEDVEIRRYSIIYELLDDIRGALEGLLEPERREVPTGRAIVLQTFSISRVGTIAGCRILSGTIERNNKMHVIRDQTVVGTYDIGSLKREKDDAKEVREGMECGIRLDRFNDVKEGDLLEGFRVESIPRKLTDAPVS